MILKGTTTTDRSGHGNNGKEYSTFPRSPESMVQWVECSAMIRETWVQSQVTSYQRL